MDLYGPMWKERKGEKDILNCPRKIFLYDLSADPRRRNNIFHVDAIVAFRLTDFDIECVASIVRIFILPRFRAT